jgi:hypothetical protein
MSKDDDMARVIADVHMMAMTRLFSSESWLPDREACGAISKKLEDLGLEERVSPDSDDMTSTPLGKELELDLIMVFVGLWDNSEMPWILEKYGLIDRIDEFRIYDRLEFSDDPERVLRPIVQKAYQDYYNPSGCLV